MANKEKFIKRKKDKAKLDTLRTFMSSFTLTVGAIAIALVTIPKSPIATIESVQVFQNEIAYQVEVTDEAHALDLSTLVIVLEGQLESYTLPLELGINIGLFENLKPNTNYRLHVYGSKGFGNERLASMYLTTKDKPGGAIINYRLIETFDHFLNYQVTVLINDSQDLYSDINLYYGYSFLDEEITNYEVIPIIDSYQIIELYDVPNENTKVVLYLEANLYTGGSIILDTFTFYTPFLLSTYFYIDQLTSTSIQYQFFKDYFFTEEISYEAKLYYGHTLVKKIDLNATSIGSYQSYAPLISFTKLKKDSTYRVVVTATYINPYTRRTETTILHEEEITTLKNYHIEYEVTTYETYSEVFIYLNDPNHYFQIPYFTLYGKDGDDYIFIDSNTFGFTPDGIGKFVSFIIEHPDDRTYKVVLGVRNQNDYYINHIFFDQKIKN